MTEEEVSHLLARIVFQNHLFLLATCIGLVRTLFNVAYLWSIREDLPSSEPWAFAAGGMFLLDAIVATWALIAYPITAEFDILLFSPLGGSLCIGMVTSLIISKLVMWGPPPPATPKRKEKTW
jgi:hypothetical protein